MRAVQMKRALRGAPFAEQVAALSPTPAAIQADTGELAGDVHRAAAHGLAGGGSTLPYLGRIQGAFGHHDVSNIRAHSGSAASQASAAMGASAYASGDDVVFGGSPDMHTAAHEAAHVVQQRAGVSLAGGVGQSGDRYEQHADRVADAVVRGGDAASVLDEMVGGAAAGDIQQKSVQRKAVQRDGEEEGGVCVAPPPEVVAAPAESEAPLGPPVAAEGPSAAGGGGAPGPSATDILGLDGKVIKTMGAIAGGMQDENEAKDIGEFAGKAGALVNLPGDVSKAYGAYQKGDTVGVAQSGASAVGDVATLGGASAVGDAASLVGDGAATIDAARKGDIAGVATGSASVLGDYAKLDGDKALGSAAGYVKGGIEIARGATQIYDAANPAELKPGESGKDEVSEGVSGVENVLKGTADAAGASPNVAVKAAGKTFNAAYGVGTALGPAVYGAEDNSAHTEAVPEGEVFYPTTGNKWVDRMFGVNRPERR